MISDISKIDNINTEEMLEHLDYIKSKIEEGSILSYAFVGIGRESVVYSGYNCFWAHKPALIGALHIKANELAQDFNTEKLARQLGI